MSRGETLKSACRQSLGWLSTPGCRSVTGDGLDKPNPRTIMTIERPMFPRAGKAPVEPKTFRTCYMDLEPEIIDLDRIAQLSFLAAQHDDMELMHFCIIRTYEMSASLRKNYAAGFTAAKEG